jgi:hypothetical protein
VTELKYSEIESANFQGNTQDTFVILRNFKEVDIKSILIDQMRVNPLAYYAILENSNVDKMQEFNDSVTYMNIVIPKEWVDESRISLKIVKKNNFALCFINGYEQDALDLEG